MHRRNMLTAALAGVGGLFAADRGDAPRAGRTR